MGISSIIDISVLAMNSESRYMDAIAGNISNSRTEGYKAGDTLFSDLFRTTSRGQEVAGGVKATYRPLINREGQFVSSTSPYDVGLSGKGLLVTSNNLTIDTSTIELTDSGRFQPIYEKNSTTTDTSTSSTIDTDYPITSDGKIYLKDMKGNYVLGWAYDSTTEGFSIGTDVTSLVPIDITPSSHLYAAQATANTEISANLQAYSPDDTSQTYKFTIFDGQGGRDAVTGIDSVSDEHTMSVQFTKLPVDSTLDLSFNSLWQVDISVDNATVNNGSAKISFDEKGKISYLSYYDTATLQNTTIDINSADSTGLVNYQFPLSVLFDSDTTSTDSATPVTANLINFNLDDMTQLGSSFNLMDFKIDGNTDGFLTNAQFEKDGQITGIYDNGEIRPLYKLPVADVMWSNNLRQVDYTHYALTDAAGDLTLYDIGDGDTQSSRAEFVPSSYEESTTDINKEFANMIAAQRAYSSASTALRTADEMLKTAAALR